MRVPTDWPNRDASRLVRSGGVEWHVQEVGAGPVALLLHGTGAATHSWRDMLHPLAQHFRVIAVDLPGHGFTRGRPAGGATLPGIARALGLLLTDLEAAPAVMVGHSAGAAVAIRMALDSDPAPHAVVAIAPALLPFRGIAQHLFPTMAKLLFVNPFAPHIFAQVARGTGTVERFLDRSTGSRIDAAGVAAYARLFASSEHCAGALGMMAGWDLAPLERDLPALAVPLLVLHGDRDAAIPVAAMTDAAARIPGAVVEIEAGRGHLLHEQMPAATVTRIVQFAQQHGIVV